MPTLGRACILEVPGAPSVVRDISVDDPGANEVLIKLVASGVCHTDLTVKMLNGNGMSFPIVLGHEGAGIVEKIGEGPVVRVGEKIVEVPVEKIVWRDREVRVEVPFELPNRLTRRPGSAVDAGGKPTAPPSLTR